MLVELSVMEQRYQAVMAVVQDGWKVTEVADRLGVARQSVHNWIARYEAGGLPALADRSHKPQSGAPEIAPETRGDDLRDPPPAPLVGDRCGYCTSSASKASIPCRVALASIAVSSVTT